MHKVLVKRLGGLSLPRKSVVRLTDRPDMTLDVYRGRKTILQQQQQSVYDVMCPLGLLQHVIFKTMCDNRTQYVQLYFSHIIIIIKP